MPSQLTAEQHHDWSVVHYASGDRGRSVRFDERNQVRPRGWYHQADRTQPWQGPYRTKTEAKDAAADVVRSGALTRRRVATAPSDACPTPTTSAETGCIEDRAEPVAAAASITIVPAHDTLGSIADADERNAAALVVLTDVRRQFRYIRGELERMDRLDAARREHGIGFTGGLGGTHPAYRDAAHAIGLHPLTEAEIGVRRAQLVSMREKEEVRLAAASAARIICWPKVPDPLIAIALVDTLPISEAVSVEPVRVAEPTHMGGFGLVTWCGLPANSVSRKSLRLRNVTCEPCREARARERVAEAAADRALTAASTAPPWPSRVRG